MHIAVVALLKPSQVKYKITPLLESRFVTHLSLFRKELYRGADDKLKQHVLPWVFKFKIIYWTATPFYIAHCLKNENTDLIVTYGLLPHAFFALVVAKLLKKPLIYSQIDEVDIAWHKSIFGRPFINLLLRSLYEINVPGTFSKQYFSSITPIRINILHSTIDTEEFAPLQQKKEFDFIYVGVLSELKRVDLLVKAISIMVKSGFETNLAVIGYGEQKPVLEQLVRDKGLQNHVKFMGAQRVDKYLLSRAKVFCMASRSEGLPCALMEAMSCSLICIATPVGNIPDVLLPEKTGYLFESADPNNMATQMRRIIENYHNLEQVRRNARELIVREHSYHSATQKWDEILDSFQYGKSNFSPITGNARNA